MFDIYDDRGALLKQCYPRTGDLPDWVAAGLRGVGFSDRGKLAANDFAVTIPLQNGVRHAYPVCNDAFTAVSCLYFDHTHASLPADLQKVAATNLLRACEDFGIEPTETLTKLASGYQEDRVPTTGARSPFRDQGISGSQMFPISTPEQVKLAADLFDQIIAKLPPDGRREFSQNLMQKAAEFRIDLPVSVQRWGGSRMSGAAVLDAIEKRAYLMSENQRELLRRATAKILEMDSEKVAELLESIDTDLGIETLWGTQIPDPRAIYTEPRVENTVKIAGIDLPREYWDDAVSKGILSNLDAGLQSAIARNPGLLADHDGHPVQEHILDGLESLGLIVREPEIPVIPKTAERKKSATTGILRGLSPSLLDATRLLRV